VVEIRDANGVKVANSTLTVTLTAFTDIGCTTTAAVGTLNGGSMAAVAGVATFTSVDYSKAETIYLKAASGALTTACSNALAPKAYFLTAASSATGTNPQLIETGDFNRDGYLDMAISEQDSNQFSVWMGAGDGTFAAKVNYATGGGTGPRGVRAGDLDNDGDLDLVVPYFTTRNVGIWLNNGSGVFSAGTALGDGTGGTLLPAVDDMNGDGKLDIVAPRVLTANMRVFLGVGDGTFAAGVDYATNAQPLYALAADFDHDGDKDILVNSFSSVNLAYLANNGNGTFAAKVNKGVGASQNGQLFAADLNKDGHLDVVVCEESSQTVGVMLGAGNGNFAAKVAYTTSATGGGATAKVIGAAIRDVNKDGKLDIVVSLRTPNQIEVLLGIGDGTFGAAASSTAQLTNAFGFASADFNRDGEDDIASASTDGNVAILLAAPFNLLGTFTAQTAVTTIAEPRDVITDDFNTDGKLDIAVASSSAGASLLRIHTGVGNGTFNAGVDFDLGPSSAVNTNMVRLAKADFNEDGKMDVANIVADSDQMSVMMGTGTASFGAATTYATGTNPRNLAVGDVDNDGDIDIAVANRGSNNVSVFINNGTGVFAAAVNYATDTSPVSVAIADVNRNGKLDLAVSTASAKTSILLGAGNGTFAAASSYTASADGGDIQVLDVTRDGKPDLIVAQGSAGVVTVYPGDGTGAYSTRNSTSVAQTVENIGLGDFDVDGDTDVACTLTSGTERFTTLPNDGTGTLGTPVNITSGNVPQGLATGDFNSDGALDFVTAAWGDSQYQVFLGTR
jgi:hypothetical protein